MGNVRESRADTRETVHGDERVNQFDQRIDTTDIDLETNIYELEKLPKIPNWVFLWGRVSVRGQPDLKNLQELRNKHWQPVLFEDLKAKADEQGKDISFLLSTELNGQKGVVGSHDMVLFTRPQKIHDMYSEQTKKKTLDQERIVTDDFNNAVPQHLKRDFGKQPIIDD